MSTSQLQGYLRNLGVIILYVILKEVLGLHGIIGGVIGGAISGGGVALIAIVIEKIIKKKKTNNNNSSDGKERN